MKFWKVFFKTVLKIIISVAALYFVYRKIDLEKLIETIQIIKWFPLVIAFLFLNLSQWTSTLRLKLILNTIDITITFKKNLALYYKGMFYNLFLPGGIGGDGFKVYLLNRYYKQPVKIIIGSLLLDRLSGLVGIVFLALLGLVVCNPVLPIQWGLWGWIILLSLCYPAFYAVVAIFFKRFKLHFLKISLLGISVNLIQAVCIITILYALGISGHIIAYITVFYISSAALVIPFTIGGVGIRELVFTFAPAFLPIEAHIGITLSLIFFLLGAISSLVGIALNLRGIKVFIMKL